MGLKPQTYALTMAAYQRRHVFQRDAIAELFIATLFRYRDVGKFQLHAFVVMPNHVHVILTPRRTKQLKSARNSSKAAFRLPFAKCSTEKFGRRVIIPIA
jgi:putative transposase